MKNQLTTIQVDQTSAIIIETFKEKAKAQGITLDVLLKRLAEELDKGREGKTTFPQSGMLTILRRNAEKLKRMQFSGSTQDSLSILYEGRAGEMYGYDPSN